MILVVENDQFPEREVAGERAGFRRDALHQVAVAGNHVGVMVDDLVARAVVAAGQMRFGDGETDRVRDALTERTRRRLDAGRVVVLGMPRGAAAPLPEGPQVVEGEVVAGEEEQGVEEHRSVTRGEHEAVTVGPSRPGGGVLQVACPEDVRHRCSAHGKAGMPGVRLLHRVSGQKPDGVDRQLIQIRLPHRLLSGRPRRPANPPRMVVWCGSTLRQERAASACSDAGLRVRKRPECTALEAQLEPGEQVLFQTRQHPMAFSGAAGMALCIALAVILLIRHNDLPLSTEVQIAVVGGLLALASALPAMLRWRHTALVLTERRLLVSAGGLRRHEMAIPLGPAVLEQEAGLSGKLLDHGTVLMTAPDGQLSSVAHVARARELVELARAQARRSPRRGAVPV